MRYRLISVSTPTAPAILRLTIDGGKQWVKANAIQGRSHSDNPIGSSNGSANQRFTGSREAFVVGSDAVYVDDVQWTRVENFLASRPTDRHYRVELGEKDVPTFIFGDGVTGAIPPTGVSNIRADYRYGADTNGNVGAGTITIDKAGLLYVSTITNPRPAAGWLAAEGADEASLERAKIAGPASLRTLTVALGPDDVETLALGASKLDASIIGVTRAKAIEEGFGPKTIELVLVPAGGAAASTAQLDAMSTFFNGDALASPPVKKRIVANQEVTAVNYAARTIDLNVTVRGAPAGYEARIKAAINAFVQPETLKADGVTFEWDFGGRVPMSRIGREVFKLNTAISDVDFDEADVELEARELPVAGTINVTLV
jgi:predicted phage baseplate assembly protein